MLRMIAVLASLLFSTAPALSGEMDHGNHMHPAIGGIVVHHPHVPAPPGAVKNAAAYMALANHGDSEDRLVAVSSPAAERPSIHRTVVEDDIAKMRPASNGVAIPAGGWMSLEPGGYHIMLMKLTGPLAEGDTVELTLSFEHAGDLTFDVPVVKPGGGMHGHGHGHGSGETHKHGDEHHDGHMDGHDHGDDDG